MTCAECVFAIQKELKAYFCAVPMLQISMARPQKPCSRQTSSLCQKRSLCMHLSSLRTSRFLLRARAHLDNLIMAGQPWADIFIAGLGYCTLAVAHFCFQYPRHPCKPELWAPKATTPKGGLLQGINLRKRTRITPRHETLPRLPRLPWWWYWTEVLWCAIEYTECILIAFVRIRNKLLT